MADTRRLDLKLKHLRAIEGDYRSILRRAEDELKHNLISRDKFNKIKAKQEKKIEKILPKVRRLQRLRNELKARNG